MKYSIIVIGKREEKYIKPLLKELNKLNDDYEIIFVFPKNDPTWKIIEKELKRDHKKIYDRGIGPGPARNLGFKNSSGKYLMFIDGDCWVNSKDIKKLFYLITKLDNVCYIHPKLIHKATFFPKNLTKIANYILGDLFAWPWLFLLNNILNVPIIITNVFVCRKNEFVYFKNYYPGEDLDFGYRLKKKTGKRFIITPIIKAYTYDRRLAQHFTKFTKGIAPIIIFFLYITHYIYFLIFKKPLFLFKYTEIR